MNISISPLIDCSSAIDELKHVEGNGASLISLYVPPYITADIKTYDSLTKKLILNNNTTNDSVTTSLQNALVKAQETFKSLDASDFKPNGMAIFIGENMKNSMDDNRMIIKAVKPKIIKIKQTMCSCDKRFNLSILEKDIININPESYGVVIVTRNGISIYSVFGDETKTKPIYSESVALPKKYSRSCSSNHRFARLCRDIENRYIRMVATKINDIFYKETLINKQIIKLLLLYWFRTILKNEIISINDIYQIINMYSFGGYVNVKGIILCGKGSIYCKVQKSEILHTFIKDAIISSIEMVYKEHDNGLNQVIEKCSILHEIKP